MTTRPPPVEYQGAAVLAAVLQQLPDPEADGSFPYGLAYSDRVANMVVFAVNGVTFHAVVTVP